MVLLISLFGWFVYRVGIFVCFILIEDEGICIGVEIVDGIRYYVDKVVLVIGVWSFVLVDFEE